MKKIFNIIMILVISSLILTSCFKKDVEKENKIQNTGSTSKVSNEAENTTVNNDDILESVAYISDIDGNGFITSSSGDKKEAKLSDTLSMGDTIETGEKAEISILFVDNSILRLNENSSFTIEKVNEVEIKNKLNKGSLWGRIIKPIGDNSKFTFEDENISAAVRGTSICMAKLDNGETAFCVVDSSKDDKTAVVLKLLKDGKEIELKEEQGIETGTGEIKANQMNVAELLADSIWINKGMKNDLIYMKDLLEKEKEKEEPNEKLIKVIKKEIEKTLPKGEEIRKFFTNKEIVEIYKEGNNIDIVGFIIKDEIIAKIKMSDNEDKQELIKKVIEIEGINKENIKNKVIEKFGKERFEEGDLDIIKNLEIKKFIVRKELVEFLNKKEEERIKNEKLENKEIPKIPVKKIIKEKKEEIKEEIKKEIKEEIKENLYSDEIEIKDVIEEVKKNNSVEIQKLKDRLAKLNIDLKDAITEDEKTKIKNMIIGLESKLKSLQ